MIEICVDLLPRIRSVLGIENNLEIIVPAEDLAFAMGDHFPLSTLIKIIQAAEMKEIVTVQADGTIILSSASDITHRMAA